MAKHWASAAITFQLEGKFIREFIDLLVVKDVSGKGWGARRLC